MNDSPEIAKRDAKITNLHYKEGVFRQYFTSPFEQYKDRVGQKFEVIKQTQELTPPDFDGEPEEDMYLIKFEDGEEIEAFGHEVCILEYDKCEPKVNE